MSPTIRHSGARYSGAPRPPSHGFTLLEVMFATILLTVGLLALAAATATTLTHLRESTQESHGASLAQSRLDRLRSSPCITQSGTDSALGVSLTWSMGNPVAGSAAVEQTVTYSTRRGTHSDSYSALLPCR